MTKFLTLRTALLGATAAAVLASSLAFTATAEDRGDRPSEITLEMMLEKAGERFDAADTDADGTITQAEADAVKSDKMSEMQGKAMEKLEKAFGRIDKDGDGVISEGDRGYGRLADRLDLEGDITLDQAKAAMAQKMADRAADRDTERGEDAPTYPLTREQALANAEARFNEADTNGDGVLSGDELPDRGGKKGGQRGEGKKRGN